MITEKFFNRLFPEFYAFPDVVNVFFRKLETRLFVMDNVLSGHKISSHKLTDDVC